MQNSKAKNTHFCALNSKKAKKKKKKKKQKKNRKGTKIQGLKQQTFEIRQNKISYNSETA